MRRFSATAAVVLLAGLVLAGCSLPRIHVLHDPLTPEEHLRLGTAYEARGEYELALEEYAEAEGLPEAHLFAGNARFALGEYEEARESWEEAMEGMPADPRAYNNLAWMLYTLGRDLARAEELAEKAVALAEPGDRAEYEDTLARVREKRAGSGSGS
jgi:tetratricopeptide (TPR) repeat protein